MKPVSKFNLGGFEPFQKNYLSMMQMIWLDQLVDLWDFSLDFLSLEAFQIVLTNF